MKRIAAALLALFSTATWSAEYDLIMMQRNSVDTGQLTRLVTRPASGADGVLGYNGATQLPQFLTIGAGLNLSGAVLSATPGGAVSWASVTGKPTFAPVATSGVYGDLTGIPATFAPAAHTQAFSTITSTPTTLGGYGITDGFVRPTGTAAQYVRGDGTLATLPVQSVPTQAAATRALNTIFQVSASRPALVSYSVQLTVTASLTGGQQGDVVLEIASDAAFTTAVQTVSITGLGQTYSLAVAIQGVQPQTGVVMGVVPAGYYARLRTVSTTGAPVFTYRAGQETLL